MSKSVTTEDRARASRSGAPDDARLLTRAQRRAVADAQENVEKAERGKALRACLSRLRDSLQVLQADSPEDYRVMAMYWGLDGECVSTIQAIARRLGADLDSVEATVKRVMAQLQAEMDVASSVKPELRVRHADSLLGRL